jgi:hypothetical protein
VQAGVKGKVFYFGKEVYYVYLSAILKTLFIPLFRCAEHPPVWIEVNPFPLRK